MIRNPNDVAPAPYLYLTNHEPAERHTPWGGSRLFRGGSRLFRGGSRLFRGGSVFLFLSCVTVCSCGHCCFSFNKPQYSHTCVSVSLSLCVCVCVCARVSHKR